MSIHRQVIIHESKDALVSAVASRFIRTVARIQAEKPLVNVVLTGGTVGIGILAGVNASPDRDSIDWERIALWWGDERWVPRGHADRNEQQALDALLSHVAIPEQNIHTMPSSDEGIELDAAAAQYAATLRENAEAGAELPHFDVTFLGMGPDGHIASLFPHRGELAEASSPVIAIRDSPKPPPERISLALDTINSSERVWLALAGTDKASPLGLALAGVSPNLVPAAGVEGRRRTVFFVDDDASADVPRDLIAAEY
ncbi:6-phosphogluconolactonase [Homoserinimonas aerilata]|uniref:6-phosphogluconolactonase n=1 Tax=Homoserinimonas aerilata TaxID=1162970 RepID=A0A542YIV9_9MICO|nr:6-phosphogluconolactonase [Homoserinimonas aerilata]TQL48028.1 6-phosphogluconolactonase [Homoserinimonas aerilata]